MAMAECPVLQVMVVTKYLFQFGFFPWNSYIVLRRYENKPYFPPRILGLEKTDSYIKYDLVQLMALFFHRSQLLVSLPASAGVAGLPLATPGIPEADCPVWSKYDLGQAPHQPVSSIVLWPLGP